KADSYNNKPATAVMNVTLNTDWGVDTGGSGYGQVVTNWFDEDRAKQVFTSTDGSQSFERTVRPGSYPNWENWREIEDVSGSQSKANSARDKARNDLAERLGYTDYAAFSSDTLQQTLITNSGITTGLIDAQAVLANVGTF